MFGVKIRISKVKESIYVGFEYFDSFDHYAACWFTLMPL